MRRSVPSTNPLEISYLSYFSSLLTLLFRSFFQLHHQINIILYLTEATALRSILTPLDCCMLSPWSVLISRTLKSFSSHCILCISAYQPYVCRPALSFTSKFRFGLPHSGRSIGKSLAACISIGPAASTPMYIELRKVKQTRSISLASNCRTTSS